MKRKMTGLLVMALIMVLAAAMCLPAGAAAAYAADASSITKVTDLEQAVLTVDGASITAGRAKNGFNKDFTYLTHEELKGINDEAAADKYFSDAGNSSFTGSLDYSARRRNDEWGRQHVSRGLLLKGVAGSLGISTTGTLAVSYRANDGYNSTYADIWKTKYCFKSGSASAGTAVEPSLALAGTYTDPFNGHNAGEGLAVPVVMIGQENALTDYNAQYMGKLTKTFTFGAKKTVLTINNNGSDKALTAGDLVTGSKAGSYAERREARCRYTDGSTEHTVDVTGETLNDLLTDQRIQRDDSTYTITDADGTARTVSGENTDKYFVAYEGTDDGTEITNSKTDVLVICPGSSKSEVMMYNVKKVSLKTPAPTAPAAVTAVKAGYDKVRLSWSRAGDVSGYYVDRYDSVTGQWATEVLDTMSGSAVSAVDTGLVPGRTYRYRVKAYLTVGSEEVIGAAGESGAVKPALDRASIRKLKKSGSSVRAYWKKVSGASGYQLVCGTNKKISKNKKSLLVKRGTAVKCTVKKLKKGKNYYFKIRAYRNVNGSRAYGPYSAVKKIKR